MKESKAPVESSATLGKGNDTHKVYNHDAYGTISLTTQTGGASALFGSDINHNQCISIKISRAELARNLSNDYIHPNETIAEVHMSHSQFAEFITGNGRFEGTPCTLAYAPARGTLTEVMPSIEKIETKAETFRKEIKDSSRKAIEKLTASITKFGEMLEAGTVSKKDLKALQWDMKCVAGNIPSNMAFVVEQAEEALEKAVTHARIEVEAMINHNVNRLGVEAAKQIGLVSAESPMKLIEAEAPKSDYVMDIKDFPEGMDVPATFLSADK